MSTGDQTSQEDGKSQQNGDQTPTENPSAQVDDKLEGEGEGEGIEHEEGSEQADTTDLQEELQKAKDQTLRVQAEMQNLRRRVDRDIENAHKYALENFLGELLPVVDNLERSLTTLDSALDENDDAQKAIREGIELTLKSFLDVLTRNNVEQVDPSNQSFDPEFHQAMTMVPHPEVPANTVIEVFQKGYLLNGRLVRPAMVVVSKGPDG
ncbi:MAG: nucleotide exchange factor GrpE [Cellvibrionales bacterium]|nr:MAG: nucleotide exchange factor GrpE [Cellvibrionales bacterium]